MSKSVRRVLAAIALFFALQMIMVSAPASAQGYSGQCSGLTTWKLCRACCDVHHPGPSICRSTCEQYEDAGFFSMKTRSASKNMSSKPTSGANASMRPADANASVPRKTKKVRQN